MSIESVMPSYHLISVAPSPVLNLSQPQGFFLVSWLFTSGDQSIRASASASVLPMNIQGWFPLGLTGLICLLAKGLSRVLFGTTVQKHQFFGTQLSLWSDSCIQTWLLEKPLKVNPNESSGTTMPTPSRRAWMLWGGEDTPWMLLPPLSSHLNRSSELWGCPGVNTSVCKRAEGK